MGCSLYILGESSVRHEHFTSRPILNWLAFLGTNRIGIHDEERIRSQCVWSSYRQSPLHAIRLEHVGRSLVWFIVEAYDTFFEHIPLIAASVKNSPQYASN